MATDPPHPSPSVTQPSSSPPGWVPPAHALVAALTVAGAIALPAPQRWDLPLLAVLVAFAVVSDVTGIETVSPKLKLSGSFVSIVVAMALLGGGPAAVVGVATIVLGWLRWREAAHYFRNNLVCYAVFPFATGTAFQAAAHALGLTGSAIGFYLLAFGAFGVALILNFLLVAGYQCLLDDTSLVDKAREALIPLISCELASALLALVAMFSHHRAGLAGLSLLVLIVVVFQHLVGQLLLSQHRGERLRRQAVTDPLTGLPNRRLLLDRLDRAVKEGRRQTVLLMDLDGFKEVNDTLGHEYGDRLLCEVGKRLVAAAGDRAVVCRIGGDEFAVLLDDPGADGQDAGALARALLDALEHPVTVGEYQLEAAASIGIAACPDDGATPAEVIRSADVAMYDAKRSGATYEFYAPERDAHSARRLALLGDLRRAIAAGELVLEFQPEVSLPAGDVHAAEALVRWQHPTLGRLPPGYFVEVAERSGMIKPLTEHVLDLALAQAANWRRQGLDIGVAVNLSTRVLADHQLPDQVERQLANAGMDPDVLTLEITETMILHDPARALANLRALKGMGVHLSIDDFGTGYSSLTHLKRLPVRELKVDRSFVGTMVGDTTNTVIVRSTIDLAHGLGLRTVAEGVEDRSTLDQLAALGCDAAQGYLISRPMPPDRFAAWLREAWAESALAEAADADAVAGPPIAASDA